MQIIFPKIIRKKILDKGFWKNFCSHIKSPIDSNKVYYILEIEHVIYFFIYVIILFFKCNSNWKYLVKKNIDAKIHYPTPIHLQPASRFLKHKKGDFPKAEMLAKTTLSLPVHEFITNKDIKKMATLINKFYS